MLSKLLDLFKENALLVFAGFAVVSLYAWWLRGEQAVPSLWRKVCTATTVVSMIIGTYWAPAQSAWYLSLGAAIVLISCWLNIGAVSYGKGSGFQASEARLASGKRIAVFLPAVWAPLVLPAVQWELHTTLRSIFSAPGSADPILHFQKSVLNCLAVNSVLLLATLLIDRFRPSLHRLR